ncbi:MAG: T9SS type A sorting domain-containing protein [Cytophagales bacterium]|nr:T9SS type A sorting domain-containing protein [Cytophagales bacterium]
MSKSNTLKVTFWTFLVLQPYLCWTQITADEHSKYWFYRQRLLTEFMVPGTMASCGTEAGGYHIPAQQTFTPNDHKIIFSDETRSIGYYIGVMATEYRLLKDAGWDTHETEKELYYAMKAYERSDARSSFLGIDGGANCQVNGYFIRGDVQEPIFQQNPVFEKYKVNNSYSFIAKYKDTHQPGNTPSDIRNITPDQVQPLMLGFVLTYKCLDDNAHYNGFYFKEKAAEFADKIATSLDDNDWKDINESGQDMGKERKTHRSFRQEGHTYITAKAASYINHHKGHKDYLKSFTSVGRFTQRRKLMVMYKLMMLNQLKDYVVGHMGAGVAAGNTGHNWRFKTHDFLTEIDAKDAYDYGLFKLAFKYINNEFDHTFDSRWHEDLTQAPCYGPQFKPDNMSSDHPYWSGSAPWRARIKWTGGDEREDGKDVKFVIGVPIPIVEEKRGKFSGWDYMIFYNLYNLYYKTTNTSYVGSVPGLPPALNVAFESNTVLDRDVKSYNWIRLSSTLTTQANRRLSAAISINLKPGFSFKALPGKGLTFTVTGPVNACGDALDEFGELLDPDPLMAQAPGQVVDERPDNTRHVKVTSQPSNSNSYKSIKTYLEERKLEIANQSERRFSVYPNPFDHYLKISSRGHKSNEGLLRLASSVGNTLLERPFKMEGNDYTLNLDPVLPPGVYLLELVVGGHKEVIKIYKR